MPCRDDGPSDSEVVSSQHKRIILLEAFLCGVLRSAIRIRKLEEIIKHIDYNEGGFTVEELIKWWENHKKKDEERKAEEARIKKQKELKKKALNKLTEEERRALGHYYE